MLARISTLSPSATYCQSNTGLELGYGSAKAFTIHQKNGLDSSLPLLYLNCHDSPCEEGGDDNSTVSKMTMIQCHFWNNDSSLFEHRQFSKSYNHLKSTRLPCRRRTGKYSNSDGSLHSDERKLLYRDCACKTNSMHLSTEDFNQALTAKLKKIQERQLKYLRIHAAKVSHVFHPRPFITTVKTGEFLMPPPEVALHLGITPNLNSGLNTDNVNMHCRSRIRQHLVSLNRKPKFRPQMYNARSQLALKATEDFAFSSSTSVSALATVRKSFKNEQHQM